MNEGIFFQMQTEVSGVTQPYIVRDWQGQGPESQADGRSWQRSLFASCCVVLSAQPTNVGIISFHGLSQQVPKTQHEVIFI